MSNYVTTQDGVVASHKDTESDSFVGMVGSETTPRIKISSTGLEMGDGTNGSDVKLYRQDANVLRTENELVVDSRFTVGDTINLYNATSKITFGDAGSADVNLYRDAANTLKTDDFFVSAGLAVTNDSIRIVNSKTPSSSTDTGDVGQICWDADYLYVCVASNSWRRFDNATW